MYKYRGVKIQPWMRHYIVSSVSVIFGISFGVLEVLFLLNNFDLMNNEKAIHYTLLNLFYAFLVVVFVAIITIPSWRKIYYMQRLSQMIWQSKFYQVNDVEEPNAFNEQIKSKVKREMATWAKIRFKMKKDTFQVSCFMGGYTFQNELKTLAPKLEEMFNADLISAEKDGYFYTYLFQLNPEKKRIEIQDMKVKKNKILLMKGLTWDIVKTPNALVVGEVGGGKTYFLLSLIIAFLKTNAKLKILDPKNADLADLRDVEGFLNKHEVQTESNKIAECIRLSTLEMKQRYEDVKKLPTYKTGKDFSYYGLEPVFIIIDEFVAFIDNLKANEKAQVNAHLSDLVLKGRQMGIFVIFATQRPDAENLKGNIRDQLGARFALGDMSLEGYRMTFKNMQKSYVNSGLPARGYCHIKGSTKVVREFFAPYVSPDYDFLEEIRKLMPDAPGALAQDSAGGAIAHEAEGFRAGVERAERLERDNERK